MYLGARGSTVPRTSACGRDLAAAARALERAPWSRFVSREDPRLGSLVRALHKDAATAREAAQRVGERRGVEEQRLLPSLQTLLAEGERLRRLRLDEELVDIVCAVLNSEVAQAKVIARLGFGGGPPLTLEQAGRATGVTRERVRQMEGLFRNGIAPALQAGGVWTPALAKVLRIIHHTSPTTSERLQLSLTEEGLIPEDFSTSSILAGAEVLGGEVEIYAAHGLISSRPLPVTPQRIAGTAMRLVTRGGATTIDDVRARLREETSLVVPADLTRLVLEAREGFFWLDQRRGWFTLHPTARNRVLNQVEKILAVAPSISIVELREGVGRDHRMKDLRLPRHVLIALCESTGRYERDGDRVLRKPGHPGWRDILSESELLLVGALFDDGPVMRRADLEQIAVHEKGLNSHSFTMCLGCSPVLVRHAPGLYGLRGHPLEPSLRPPALG